MNCPCVCGRCIALGWVLVRIYFSLIIGRCMGFLWSKYCKCSGLKGNYHLLVLEVRSPEWVSLGSTRGALSLSSFTETMGVSQTLSFPAFRSYPHSLVRGPIYLQSQQSAIRSFLQNSLRMLTFMSLFHV